MFTVGAVHTRDHDPGYSFAGGRNLPRGDREGLIGCPFQDGTQKEGASTPLDRLRPSGQTGSFSCTTYL